MSQLAICSITNKVWMLTGLMMIWLSVFANSTPSRSETSPRAQSEKIKELRAKIAELTQNLEEARESYQMARDNLEGIQATCVKNARELRAIRSAIKNVRSIKSI
jgi:septation ring formation regulator EzrA